MLGKGAIALMLNQPIYVGTDSHFPRVGQISGFFKVKYPIKSG
ncbi:MULTISPECIES: hypothetical protein [Limnospira]|nr:hypothetical protein [Limnospira sp. PMC 289.06]MDT9297164.1 hypothetical protein [Arthrospira platensis PCC 7345]MDT9312677.1 hypothetical protein [Limnospira sp. Paracas R14]WAK74466.1 hypothetical protein AP9108_34000 [Arthrospira sp. PCC 9108]